MQTVTDVSVVPKKGDAGSVPQGSGGCRVGISVSEGQVKLKRDDVDFMAFMDKVCTTVKIKHQQIALALKKKTDEKWTEVNDALANDLQRAKDQLEGYQETVHRMFDQGLFMDLIPEDYVWNDSTILDILNLSLERENVKRQRRYPTIILPDTIVVSQPASQAPSSSGGMDAMLIGWAKHSNDVANISGGQGCSSQAGATQQKDEPGGSGTDVRKHDASLRNVSRNLFGGASNGNEPIKVSERREAAVEVKRKGHASDERSMSPVFGGGAANDKVSPVIIKDSPMPQAKGVKTLKLPSPVKRRVLQQTNMKMFAELNKGQGDDQQSTKAVEAAKAEASTSQAPDGRRYVRGESGRSYQVNGNVRSVSLSRCKLDVLSINPDDERRQAPGNEQRHEYQVSGTDSGFTLSRCKLDLKSVCPTDERRRHYQVNCNGRSVSLSRSKVDMLSISPERRGRAGKLEVGAGERSIQHGVQDEERSKKEQLHAGKGSCKSREEQDHQGKAHHGKNASKTSNSPPPQWTNYLLSFGNAQETFEEEKFEDRPDGGINYIKGGNVTADYNAKLVQTLANKMRKPGYLKRKDIGYDEAVYFSPEINAEIRKRVIQEKTDEAYEMRQAKELAKMNEQLQKRKQSDATFDLSMRTPDYKRVKLEQEIRAMMGLPRMSGDSHGDGAVACNGACGGACSGTCRAPCGESSAYVPSTVPTSSSQNNPDFKQPANKSAQTEGRESFKKLFDCMCQTLYKDDTVEITGTLNNIGAGCSGPPWAEGTLEIVQPKQNAGAGLRPKADAEPQKTAPEPQNAVPAPRVTIVDRAMGQVRLQPLNVAPRPQDITMAHMGQMAMVGITPRGAGIAPRLGMTNEPNPVRPGQVNRAPGGRDGVVVDAFDFVMPPAQPSFAHMAPVVRGQEERRQLPAHECAECEKDMSKKAVPGRRASDDSDR